MTAARDRPARTALLVALAVPPLAWMTAEIGLAGALRWSCDAVGGGFGAGWSIGALLACGFAAALARHSMRMHGRDGIEVFRFGARVALLGSGVFALAIAFQTLAILIVPSCAR